ncbi:hypothetical protein [Vibrio celticus]|uniref:hypothetical protein n=1 Tax=Vibrio celticus TaxID=446372 RepID=UPI0040696517
MIVLTSYVQGEKSMIEKWGSNRILILVISVGLIVILAVMTLPWIVLFKDYFYLATTEDFANFGDYIGGVLTPIFTLLSALFIGIQIISNSNNQKLERLLSDFNEAMDKLNNDYKIIERDEHKSDNRSYNRAWLEELSNKSEQSILRKGNRERDEKYGDCIYGMKYIVSLLEQIEEIDPAQERSSRDKLIASIGMKEVTTIQETLFYQFADVGLGLNDVYWVSERRKRELEIQAFVQRRKVLQVTGM